MKKMTGRFKLISTNYTALAKELFAQLGQNYDDFQKSVAEPALQHILCGLSRKYLSISDAEKCIHVLDIGVGEGETSWRISGVQEMMQENFKVTGIDTDSKMLAKAREKLGNSVELLEMNACDMHRFSPKQFPLIISALTIHNINKAERVNFWNELLRLKPAVFILADKIADLDEKTHQENLQRELTAIKDVYLHRHRLTEQYEAWIKHYKEDERERLEISEIEKHLGDLYRLEITREAGMSKTLIAIR